MIKHTFLVRVNNKISAKSSILMFGMFLVLLLIGCGNQSSNETSIESLNQARAEYSAASFKQFLKRKKVDLSGSIQNEYGDLQGGNLYSNHWLNFNIDLPDNWTVDRGLSPNTVIRAFQPDSAFTFSVHVVNWKENYPVKNGVNPNTIAYLNSMVENGDYAISLAQLIKDYSNQVPINLELREIQKPLFDFVLITYLTRHIDNGEEFFMKTSSYQTNIFNMTYTLSYSSLDFLHDEAFASRVVTTFRAALPPPPEK